MAKITITEFEDSLESEKKGYFTCLQETFTLLGENPSKNEVQVKMTSLHSKGVNFFNLFERSIDEYGLPYFNLNMDTKNRKIEDAESIIEVIFNHWKTIKMISEEYNVIYPSPSETSYSSIQRLLKYFQPEKLNELKQKFMDANLPTNGFDSKEKFSGWQIGSKNLTITQIVVGLVFILGTGLIIFNKDVLNGMQYFFSRAVLSLGLTLIGSALLEGSVKLDWTIQKSVTLKAVGWVSLFIMLYYFNPPAAPMP